MIELRQLFQCMDAVQMREKFYHSIESSISSSRLSTYQNHSHNADITIANYVLNAKLSEKFYFLLQNLEVTLRNAIYNGFKKHYPTSDFFYLNETNSRNRYLPRREKHSRECWKMLCGAKYSLRHTTINDGKIIAELNFGFWTEFMLSSDAKYSNMWRKIYKDVFPHYTIVHSIDSDKVVVGQVIDNLRKFRNRIFHYEPIFNHPNIEQIHEDILKVLKWLNEDIYKISCMFDEMPSLKAEKRVILKKLRREQ